ncbi:MAG TPA: ribosomal protein S18-alanine N-acetyltransferase [Trichocoleus sp.]
MISAGKLCCHFPNEEDLPAIVSLDQRCLGGLWSESGYRRELESPNSLFRILSTPAVSSQAAKASRAKDSTTLDLAAEAEPSTASIIGIGCLWAILDEAHITVLGIDPAYQGQGLGQWLLLHLLLDARRQNLQHATLEVRPSNTRAHKLYYRFGFQQVGRRKRYYSDGEDALLLWRSGLQNREFLQEIAHWRPYILTRLRQHGWQVDDHWDDEKWVENRILKGVNIFDKN